MQHCTVSHITVALVHLFYSLSLSSPSAHPLFRNVLCSLVNETEKEWKGKERKSNGRARVEEEEEEEEEEDEGSSYRLVWIPLSSSSNIEISWTEAPAAYVSRPEQFEVKLLLAHVFQD
ncbi:uncharacterized protein [Physcomitrium patens]|uniref:Uncharacterized protein n=1 Tax=Physcomitrium patens TaxID=3218 RepID=A0A7I4CTR0_PHYPA